MGFEDFDDFEDFEDFDPLEAFGSFGALGVLGALLFGMACSAAGEADDVLGAGMDLLEPRGATQKTSPRPSSLRCRLKCLIP